MNENRISAYFDDPELKRTHQPMTKKPRTAKSKKALKRANTESIGEAIRTRIIQRLAEIKVDKPSLTSRLQATGLEYPAAHALATRMMEGPFGNPNAGTRQRLLKVLELKDISEIIPNVYGDPIAATGDAVLASVVSAPLATEEQLLADFRKVLADPVRGPYLRMATKILAHLTSE